MYNRYIPNGANYTRITEDDGGPMASPPPGQTSADSEERSPDSHGLSALLKSLKLDKLDTGDVLLLLILLFLFLEGDDMELIITLGLTLLLGLDQDAR